MEQEIRAPLSASELTGVDEEKYLTTVSTDMSLFLDRKEVQCRTGFDQMTEVPWMNYILVEIHIPILYDACFQELCREKEERTATYVDGSLVPAQYQMVGSNPMGSREAISSIWPGNSGRVHCAGKTGSSSWERAGT